MNHRLLSCLPICRTSIFHHLVILHPTYQFSRAEFFQQLDREKFTHQGSCLTGATIARVGVYLFIELQAVRHQRVQGRSGEMRCPDLLVYWFDQKLRHLWGSQLIPCQGRLAPRRNEQPNGVGEMVHWKGVCYIC